MKSRLKRARLKATAQADRVPTLQTRCEAEDQPLQAYPEPPWATAQQRRCGGCWPRRYILLAACGPCGPAPPHRRHTGCLLLQVTLPARFLTTTAHFVAVLTILFDVVGGCAHHQRECAAARVADGTHNHGCLLPQNTLAGQVLLAQSEAPLPYADSDQQALASQCVTQTRSACMACEAAARRREPGTARCHHRRLRSAAYVAVACFAIEFVGLFAGVSLFMRGHACLYILAHFVGTIIIGLLYTNVRTRTGTALI